MWGSLNLYLSDKDLQNSNKKNLKRLLEMMQIKQFLLLKLQIKICFKKSKSSFLEASKMLKTNKSKLIDKLRKFLRDIEGDPGKKIRF